MEPELLEARYYETYFVANAINNVLASPMDYLRNIDEFYGDLQYVRFLAPFQKFSAFHQFIEFVVESLIFEALYQVDLDDQKRSVERFEGTRYKNGFMELPLNGALRHYMIDHESFDQWLQRHGKAFSDADEDDTSEYYAHLQDSGAYGSLLDKIVEEVFFIMFLNRHSLMLFHEMLAGVICDVAVEDVEPEYQGFFSRDGVLRRAKIPTWAQRAVFYRDRGRCVLCNKDLSGLLTLQNEENFDHLVPLTRGGLNDVTNLQLLCVDCNRRKSGGEAVTSVLYEKWF